MSSLTRVATLTYDKNGAVLDSKIQGLTIEAFTMLQYISQEYYIHSDISESDLKLTTIKSKDPDFKDGLKISASLRVWNESIASCDLAHKLVGIYISKNGKTPFSDGKKVIISKKV